MRKLVGEDAGGMGGVLVWLPCALVGRVWLARAARHVYVALLPLPQPLGPCTGSASCLLRPSCCTRLIQDLMPLDPHTNLYSPHAQVNL